MRSMASWNAAGSASKGVMSLNRMPGLGKSGMSRMYAFRSIARPRRAPVVPMTYGLPTAEATMRHVRRAALADAPLLAEYNRRLALETEGKALAPEVLAAG